MRYDHTRLTIRERDLWEILDLAFVVLKTQFKPLLINCSLLWGPMMLINWFLLWGLIRYEQTGEFVSRHCLAMTCLAIIQAPLATLGGTLFLGRNVFYDPLPPGKVLTDIVGLAPRWLWGFGVVRGVIPAWVLAGTIDPSEPFSAPEGWLIGLTFLVCVMRSFNAYLAEVLVLERSAYWVGKSQQSSVSRRLKMLRTSGSGDGISRMISLSLPTAFLCFVLAGNAWFGLRIVAGTNRFDMIFFSVCWTLALGLCAMFWMVVNYLSYLDLRIRREGWELELQLRGAAAELKERTL